MQEKVRNGDFEQLLHDSFPCFSFATISWNMTLKDLPD